MTYWPLRTVKPNIFLSKYGIQRIKSSQWIALSGSWTSECYHCYHPLFYIVIYWCFPPGVSNPRRYCSTCCQSGYREKHLETKDDLYFKFHWHRKMKLTIIEALLLVFLAFLIFLVLISIVNFQQSVDFLLSFVDFL